MPNYSGAGGSYTAPNTINYGQIGGAISGIGGALTSIFAGQAQQANYEMQARARKFQAQQAVSQAKLTALQLKQNYGEMAANNAVIAAAQGRSFSSGSIQNISLTDRSKLQWDLDFNELTGEIGKTGAIADVAGLKGAGAVAKQSGYTKGLMQLTRTAIDYAKVK